MAKNPKAPDTRSGRSPTRRPRPRRAKAVPEASSAADIEDLAPSVPGAAAPGAAAPTALRAQLLRWYDAHRRDLPWRCVSGSEEERAYAVWVSEVMLQQTRVPVVVAYYERWMARWPTVRSLAAATQEVRKKQYLINLSKGSKINFFFVGKIRCLSPNFCGVK